MPAKLFSNYINPDDIEKTMKDGIVDFEKFGLALEPSEVREWFLHSPFLKKEGLTEAAKAIQCVGATRFDFRPITPNSYFASVLSDAIRRKLLEAGKSFTFETVMSAPDKVELLREAQTRGYRTYLYFVSTESSAINLLRVANRVAEGGHNVPSDKILARYGRSLTLVREAVRYSNRAYFFDASQSATMYVAEITDGKVIDLKSDEMPNWFKQYVWDRF